MEHVPSCDSSCCTEGNYSVKKPVFVPIRPPIGGKNTHIPSTDIGPTQSPDLLNVRFNNGTLQTRDGFGVKYQGLRNVPLNISKVFSADGTLLAILAIDTTGVHQSLGGTGLFKPVTILDTSGTVLTLTGVIASSYISIAVGEGTYTPHHINSASIYPTSGYAPICAFTNQEDGVIIIIPGSDGDPLIGEELDTAVGTSGARCVTFFGNKLVVGGTTDSPSEIVWSADSAFDDFSGTGSGSALLGNETERIQNMKTLGEYLVVYKEHSIYFGRLTGQTTPAIVFDSIPTGGIGLAVPLSLSDAEGSHIFLGDDDVYMLNQTGLQPIGTPVSGDIWGLTGNRGLLRGYANRAFSVVVPERKEYWLFTPSGHIPEVTNLLTDGDMSLVLFEADTTNGSDTIASVPDEVFPLVRRYSYLTEGANAIGGVIPADAQIIDYDATAHTITLDKNATFTATGYALVANNESNWIAQSNNGTVESVVGGNIGGMFQRITLGTPIYLDFSISQYDLLSYSGDVGDTLSVLAWLRSSTGTTVSLQIECWNSGFPRTVKYRTLTIPAGTVFKPYIVSITSTTEYDSLNVEIYDSDGAAEDDVLDIDAIQLVDMTDIDQRFWYQDTDGYIGPPGLLDHYYQLKSFPYVAGSIGSWLCDTVWVCNYQTKAWSCWALSASTAATDIQSLAVDDVLISQLKGAIDAITWRYDDRLLSNDTPSVIITPSDAQVHEIGPQYSYDWQDIVDYPIVSYWQSKDFTVVSPDGTDLPNADKTVSRITLFHDVSHVGVDVEIGVSVDGGLTWTRQTVPMRTGHSETFADFFVTGPQARFSIKTETPGFRVTGFSLKLIQRGEVNGL
jgi:hypothetical protein